ncbi:MAG TPA: lipase maturation factor family protein [Tepidisphaeraceae bacterium]|nr:lipase maturation factor family protein [Tepidisphaeraceae bacterium]
MIQTPVVLYDGKCGFCKRHIARWCALSGDAIQYRPFQEAAGDFPNLDREQLSRAMHLVEPDGSISRGAAAVLRVQALSGKMRWPAWCYANLPGFALVADGAYRFIAHFRWLVDPIDRWLFGASHEPTSHRLTRDIFLRCLGAIYLMAFVSLWLQISGLIGSHGILPASNYLQAIRDAIPGNERFWRLPTLGWLGSSDGFLDFLCAGGTVMSLLLMAGVAPLVMLIGLWVFYLSLVNIGQDFLSFQWDSLLLEAGFAAIFLAPLQIWMRWRKACEPSHIAIWLQRWLAFRIMFLSGMTKLVAGDTSWTDGTALTYHYWTQPLPPMSAWYMNRAPFGFLKFSTQMMFVAELVIPFFIFTPRIPRRIAFWGIVLFQFILVLTGNYGFFNLLTMVICIPLLEDAFWFKRLRRNPLAPRRQPLWIACLYVIPALVLIPITFVHFAAECEKPVKWPMAVLKLTDLAEPFRSANGYGLFRVMTKHRYEIIVEGSNNGVDWKTYEFKYKPGEVDRRPAFLPGHMPRLDWQMWFAALYDQPSPWFMSFLERLLRGTPQVTGLLANNPFPEHPPRYVRAELYDYHFADDPHGQAWWKRQLVNEEYVPIAHLRQP